MKQKAPSHNKPRGDEKKQKKRTLLRCPHGKKKGKRTTTCVRSPHPVTLRTHSVVGS